MKTISLAQYQAVTAGARVLTRDRRGEKVLVLAGGEYLKLFRRKRRLSSAAWSPYAARFARAAGRLAALGIPTVEVTEVFRVPGRQRDAVVYRPLPGETLRDALAASAGSELLAAFARFLAELHRRGVYFRAIHPGNVVVLPAERFGLIDVSEARFAGRPLGLVLRLRNFRPLLREAQDRRALADFGGAAFLDRYLAASGLGGLRAACLRRGVARAYPDFSPDTRCAPAG